MKELVVTALGRDRAGLVGALSGVVARHGANWEQSSMAELAGTFAGVVLVRVPPASLDALLADLDQLEADGLLRLEVEQAPGDERSATPGNHFTIEVTGQDHPGIVHDITRKLADHALTIESFTSEVVPAPLGGQLFKAELTVRATAGVVLDDVQELLEDVSTDLIVDVDAAISGSDSG